MSNKHKKRTDGQVLDTDETRTDGQVLDTDRLKEAISTINKAKAEVAAKEEQLLRAVMDRKKEFDEICSLYRELFGHLPWDNDKKKGKAKGAEYMVVVSKDDKKHEIKGKGWNQFGDVIYGFLNVPGEDRTKIVWHKQWAILEGYLLKAGYCIESVFGFVPSEV